MMNIFSNLQNINHLYFLMFIYRFIMFINYLIIVFHQFISINLYIFNFIFNLLSYCRNNLDFQNLLSKYADNLLICTKDFLFLVILLIKFNF